MTQLCSISRHNLKHIHSVRWDEAKEKCGDDAIPLSVADMDFASPQPVVQAVVDRASIGDYCYTYLDKTFSKAVSRWFQKRHSWCIQPETIVPVGRMVESLPAILREALPESSAVMIPYPAYSPTPTAVEAAGFKVVPWELKQDNNGVYRFDFEKLEALGSDVSAIIITNPHNPTGRVWSQEELAAVASVAESRSLLVISDEMHADLTFPGHAFHPYLTSSEKARSGIAFTSPGKTFNMAGLETVNIIVPEKDLREQVRSAIDKAGCHNPRFFAQVATEAAYEHCDEWLNELLDLVGYHARLLRDCLSDINGACLPDSEGTYLAWVDLRETGLSDKQIEQRLLSKKLVVDSGTDFGPQGSGFIRVNLATTTSLMKQALKRMAAALG